jgi:hypothetical protein
LTKVARTDPAVTHAGSSLTAAEHAPLVMIVDDDPNARDLLAATVHLEGYRVIAQRPTARPRSHWRASGIPDIFTLDVLMPRMDGWTVLTALKSDPELAETPIIIVTVLGAAEQFGGFGLAIDDENDVAAIDMLPRNARTLMRAKQLGGPIKYH